MRGWCVVCGFTRASISSFEFTSSNLRSRHSSEGRGPPPAFVMSPVLGESGVDARFSSPSIVSRIVAPEELVSSRMSGARFWIWLGARWVRLGGCRAINHRL